MARRGDALVARAPKPDIATLVVRMANENPTWGYTRIRGGLKSRRHDVARNTIKAILKDHGIEPAPERCTKTPLEDIPRRALCRDRLGGVLRFNYREAA